LRAFYLLNCYNPKLFSMCRENPQGATLNI
jgi:hypothetical protein